MVKKIGENIGENDVKEARMGRNGKKEGVVKTTKGGERSSKIDLHTEKYALYLANKSSVTCFFYFVYYLFHPPTPFVLIS